MTSINGIGNSVEDIAVRKNNREQEVAKKEADMHSNIFLDKFKKGAKVETVQYPKSGGLFLAGLPKIEKIYDENGKFLYTRTTYKDGSKQYDYTIQGREVSFYDEDDDGNMDSFHLTNPDGSQYYAKSSNDNGKFDEFGKY